MNMQLVHRNTIQKFRRQVKQISLILSNRRTVRDDEFSEELKGIRTELRNAIRNLSENTYPWEVEIPAPQDFRDAEDAKKHFNNLASEYDDWLDALRAYRKN